MSWEAEKSESQIRESSRYFLGTEYRVVDRGVFEGEIRNWVAVRLRGSIMVEFKV